MRWGTAILTSFTGALALVFAFVPKVLGVSRHSADWLTDCQRALESPRLSTAQSWFDRLATRIGLTRMEQQMGVSLDAAGILGKGVYWFVFLIFLVRAVDALGLTA